MASPYLISRIGDPIFALFIGTSAAWLRIRREEVERFHAAFSLSASREEDTTLSNNGDSTADMATPPSNRETLQLLGQRLGRINLREWNWRGAIESKDRKVWGIVDGPER